MILDAPQRFNVTQPFLLPVGKLPTPTATLFGPHEKFYVGLFIDGWSAKRANTVPVSYAIRFSGPVTALTARRVRHGRQS